MESTTEYGRAGILGVLTPQANTTVEAEFWCLLPPHWNLLNARLTSDAPTIEARLVDYADRFLDTCARFANAPLTALAIGCTGTSYLIGRERESALVDEIQTRLGVRCVTAALAATQALRALQARRIALVTPYPAALTAASERYWQSQGFEVVAKVAPATPEDRFHPIYAMPGAGALAALRGLEHSGCDAILMLGTGMPTLATLLAVTGWNGPPALSCNLALAWAGVADRCDHAQAASDLRERWLDGSAWRARFHMLYPPRRTEH